MWLRGVLCGGCLVFAIAHAAHAYEIDDLIIESWAGGGEHESVMVLDFWPGDGQDDSFAFGYRFDGASITGVELVQGLNDADNGLTFGGSGGFVTDFWYDDGDTVHHTGFSWPESWWSYWGSEDFGEAWTSSAVGAGERVLFDGDTDGWLAKPGDDLISEPVTPIVPEPSTLFVLFVGGLIAVRRSR